MLPSHSYRKRFGVVWLALVLAALSASGLAFRAGGQEAAANGQKPSLPVLEDRKPQTSKAIKDFLEPLTGNDAYFDVTVGQGRILTTKVDLAAPGKPPALIAVGDPSVVDFSVISARQIRVVGQRTGVSDLSITTSDGQIYTFEVRVLANLDVLRVQLLQSFPDASVRLSQMRDHVIVEGQARDTTQIGQIINMIEAFLKSVEIGQARKIAGTKAPARPEAPKIAPPEEGKQPGGPAAATPEAGLRQVAGTIPEPLIINLLRVPGPQQVLLKVRVAELNRTALRQVGMDFVYSNRQGTLVGSQIGGNNVDGSFQAMISKLLSGSSNLGVASGTTLFGVFENGNFATFYTALRKNDMLKILAEPNLMAMNGHRAEFLAGGEFPVPVPQGGAGAVSSNTIEWKQFGVRLGFVPTILDGGAVRLAVDPEVSTIDFAIGTTLVVGGDKVPGVNTRKAHTTVELREGQTLAIAGLLSVTLEGSTSRIPGLGDLPVLGPFFSNTSNKRTEKELIVLVTPYLVQGMTCDQLPPVPGAEVGGPNDLEFYLGNRIEGRTGRDWRATTGHYTTLPGTLPALYRLQGECLRGPYGYCD